MKNAFVICGLILTGVVAVARTEEPTVTKRFVIISQYVIEIDGEDNGTIEVKTTYMVGRERIPDVNLEIGKPFFETQKVENRLRVPMNTWMLLHSIKAKDVSDGSPTQLVVMMKIAERKR